ncbi:uncharacterized protein N7496_010865 [Penicillium cataractarum]|uniref:Uncharacterized protein n=1 Tax=Penicillium cataractarum TaxID=2100454 RepID=A0A9W9UV21_9EURO|nr:uncharacterized protein N7496_010865 [Penicillium cataractarum]KAJ5358452.1 hypothetical protein N7496_010865 [Penicillium cataractarum]
MERKIPSRYHELYRLHRFMDKTTLKYLSIEKLHELGIEATQVELLKGDKLQFNPSFFEPQHHNLHQTYPLLDKTKKILWQEPGEFVAWIKHELKNKPVTEFHIKSLLIAQDHEEMFLCVAQYDEDYVKFLTDCDDLIDGFLEIQEYGPWFIHSATHMEELATFIYSYCQAVTDHINKSDS